MASCAAGALRSLRTAPIASVRPRGNEQPTCKRLFKDKSASGYAGILVVYFRQVWRNLGGGQNAVSIKMCDIAYPSSSSTCSAAACVDTQFSSICWLEIGCAGWRNPLCLTTRQRMRP